MVLLLDIHLGVIVEREILEPLPHCSLNQNRGFFLVHNLGFVLVDLRVDLALQNIGSRFDVLVLPSD